MDSVLTLGWVDGKGMGWEEGEPKVGYTIQWNRKATIVRLLKSRNTQSHYYSILC